MNYCPPAALALSPQAVERIGMYEQELLHWNKRINLIGQSSVTARHQRHFDNSLGIIPFLPAKPCHLADLGSGAGLPGFLLAVTTSHHVTLVESIHKKSAFLRHVAQRCNTTCIIKTQRIETLAPQQFDVVTARALADLTQLWQWSKPLLRSEGYCVFLKGDSSITEKEVKNLQLFDSQCNITCCNHPFDQGIVVLLHSK